MSVTFGGTAVVEICEVANGVQITAKQTIEVAPDQALTQFGPRPVIEIATGNQPSQPAAAAANLGSHRYDTRGNLLNPWPQPMYTRDGKQGGIR